MGRYCKIYKKNIDEIHCLEIYYEINKYFKSGYLQEIRRTFNIDSEEAKRICDTCEYNLMD